MAVIHASQARPLAPPARKAAPIDLLLVEPNFLLRRTVASVARELGLANPNETTSLEAAERMVVIQRFDALFVSLEDEEPALELLTRVRDGATRCDVSIPVAVTAPACSPALAQRLKNLDVRRLLLRPFKVKDVMGAIEALRVPVAAPARQAA